MSNKKLNYTQKDNIQIEIRLLHHLNAPGRIWLRRLDVVLHHPIHAFAVIIITPKLT